jgi:ATP-dependent Lhr-like helicase
VSDFEKLHPALQHHIVNSLGWKSLRALQERAIEPVLSGANAILVAQTAAGKTEAAFFPVLSRMMSEEWPGLSVLYLCPLKALLNNLESRLAEYCAFGGCSVALWHGDVPEGRRRKILGNPPNVLLTTPESLEVMLVSRRIDHRVQFANVRCAIVDEVHSFAGDDRGWHLLSLLERLSKISGQPVQRLGLSATIGNPEQLGSWLAGSSPAERRVISVPAATPVKPDIQLDYVGSIANAARVIAGLHQGEKRLVFVDSRARVEEVAAELRRLRVDTYVSHSSVSLDERQRAEAAFAEGSDCVIIATSTLELGIDVGDLDRVIQIDAPTTVASFLQRMGRTGRRPGTTPNMLFLATTDEALLRAAALICLRSAGFVEPIVPPPLPYHILAQQIMALSLQERGIGRHRWREWIGAMPGFATMDEADIEQIVAYMLDEAILFEDGGVLSLGLVGEDQFGWRNFMELFSVFTSPPLFKIMHGRSEIGEVHRASFEVKQNQVPILQLGGRDWVVKHIDWDARIAYVEPSDSHGRSRWPGDARALRLELCHAIRDVLAGETVPAKLSQRAESELADIREEFAWVERGTTAVVRTAAGYAWWTFAGLLANASLRAEMGEVARQDGRLQNLEIALETGATSSEVERRIAVLRDAPRLAPPVSDDAIEGLKFSRCLPHALATKELKSRLRDDSAEQHALHERTRFVAVE